MRIAATALAICAALAAAPAAAQQAAFVPLPGATDRRVSFLDTASIIRTGTDADVRVLVATARPQGDGPPVSALLQSWRVSCDWSSLVMSQTAELGPDGAPLTPEKTARAMGFAPFDGPQARIAGLACNPPAHPPGALVSVQDALAEAARTTVRPQPVDPSIPTVAAAPPRVAEPSGPIPFVNHPDPKRKAYGAVRIEPETGNALYLDWANLKRKDGKVLAITLELLGEDRAAYRESRMKVSSVEFDCKARTVQVLGYTTFGGSFTNRRQEDRASPPRAAAGWPLGGELLDAACKGRKPKQTFYAEYDADRFVQQGRTGAAR